MSKVIDRKAFPATVAYWDNEIKFIRMGYLHDSDWKEFHNFLQNFPKSPLTDQEIKERIEKKKNRCILSYYVFPTNLDSDKKRYILSNAYKYNELPIDVDSVAPDINKRERLRMLEGSCHFAKLILWVDKEHINGEYPYTALANDIMIAWSEANQELKFTNRDLNEVIK